MRDGQSKLRGGDPLVTAVWIVGLVILAAVISAAGSVLTLGWVSRQVGGVEIEFDTDGEDE